MNKIYKSNYRLRLLTFVFLMGMLNSLSAQLSGAYTIDNTSATGGSNYASWTDFSTAINSQGVSGPVTVNVLTDQTESQITFNSITGTSSTNTVIISGNGKLLSASVADAVILMNGADYFVFDKLLVRNTINNASLQGFRFTNDANYNVIKNCTIEFSALTTGSTSGGAYVSFSTSATNLTTTSTVNHGAYNVIDKNLMRTTNSNSPGPTYGLAIQGSSSTYTSVEQNNTISNNTIQNFYSIGIRNYYSNGNQINNNDISRANATSYNCSSTLTGIYSYYTYATSRATTLDGNNLHDWPYSGANTSSAPSTVTVFNLSYNYGNATYRFSTSGNSIKNIFATSNMYLGNNNYNYYFDLNNNFADNNDVTVSSSSSYNFYGWYNGYTYGSYRFNGNTIQNCDGGYYWYGIRNYYPQSVNGVQEINYNIIQNNIKSYYYTYRIYSYYAQYSNANYPVNIVGNVVKNNSSDYYYTYNIYTYYYGAYNITDNTIDNNSSGYYYMYDIYNYYYGTYNVQRNKITGNKNISGNVGYHYSIYNYYNYNVNITDNLICNNIGYYNTYGIYAYSFNSGSYTANIRQNTVKIDGTLSSYTYHYSYALYCYLYYHTSVVVQGNIVDINGNYGGYPAYTYNTNAANIKWDFNSYFINNLSYQYWYCPAGSANTFSAWSTLGFAGSNEKSLDPKWNNAGSCDLRSNTLANQNNIVFNALNVRDANGVLRNTVKNDRGALEGFLDINLMKSDFAPNANECSGYTFAPTITMKNNFVDAVSGFELAMTVNGVAVTSKMMGASIAVGDSGKLKLDLVKFSIPGTQIVKIFLKDADDNPANDTLFYTFNIKVSPGGGVLSLNTAKSAAKAVFDITGKPDITTNGQAIVYDITPPSRLGYSNTDHLFNGGTKWYGTVSAVTKFGVPVPGSQVVYNNPVGTTNAFISFTPSLAFVDSIVTIAIKISDFVIGCDTTYYRSILVAPQGVPDFKLPAIICDKDEVFFDNTSTVTSGALLSTWDFGDGSPTVDATSPVYKFNGPGTYNVKLTVVTAPYGYETTITKTINVNEIPAANFKNINACEGTSVKLNNTTTIGSGSLTYSWDFGDGSPAVTSTNTSKLYALPGGYKVTLTASGNGCINVISKNVYQFARPVAVFSKVSGSCENDLFEFKNASFISLGEFGNSWDFGDGGNKATVSDPVYDFLTPGIKNVKLNVVSEYGCVDSVIVPVTVKTIATTSFTAPFTCSRSATQFVNTTNLNGEVLNNWEWNFGDGYTSSANAPLHSWNIIGPTQVTLKTNLANGCSSEQTQTLKVGVQPLVNFQMADQCAGSEVQFTNMTSFTQGDITYLWDFGDNSTSVSGSPRHTYSTGVGTQTFTVILKATIFGGCKDSAVKTININPLPTTCDFDIERDYTSSLTAYKLTPKGGALTGIDYTWLTGDGGTIDTKSSGTSYSYAGIGKYCVTMVAKNTSGCECSKTKCVTLSLDVNDPVEINKLITIYPNPTNGLFKVAIDPVFGTNMQVNVYNSVGQAIKSIQVNGSSAEIDLSIYANGVYMVKVISGNQVATKHIILNK